MAYRDQGNADYYTADAISQRAEMMDNWQISAAIHLWWRVVPKAAAGAQAVSKADYMTMCTKIHRALCATATVRTEQLPRSSASDQLVFVGSSAPCERIPRGRWLFCSFVRLFCALRQEEEMIASAEEDWQEDSKGLPEMTECAFDCVLQLHLQRTGTSHLARRAVTPAPFRRQHFHWALFQLADLCAPMRFHHGCCMLQRRHGADDCPYQLFPPAAQLARHG